MQFRGGPAAVTGDEARRSTGRLKPIGKGGPRLTRESEDGHAIQGANRWQRKLLSPCMGQGLFVFLEK